jgi:hypothetical protein
MTAGTLGQLCTPNIGNALVPGVQWAADNGCFSDRWDPGKWRDWLTRQPVTALFATVPDVVGDCTETRRRWDTYAPTVIDLGFPAAYVLQDGETRPPWDEMAALFIGGSTAYKMSADTQRFTREAQDRGMWTHIGRVNSLPRMKAAVHDGYDSADGTYLTYGPDTNLPKLLRMIRLAHEPRLIPATPGREHTTGDTDATDTRP